MNTKTTPPADFDEVTAAHAKVRATIEALCADYDATVAEIDTIAAELEELPQLAVPFEDMKTAVLDFVEASGKRYAGSVIRGIIASFATGGVSDNGRYGLPLRYADIEGAISGSDARAGWAQLLTERIGESNDQVLYFLFADLVKAGLASVMEEMTPDEFGYGKIRPNEIGTPRAERRALIDSLRGRHADLKAKRDGIAAKLAALGYSITQVLKR